MMAGGSEDRRQDRWESIQVEPIELTDGWMDV